MEEPSTQNVANATSTMDGPAQPVSLDASEPELLKARKRALVQFHPDRLVAKGADWHKVVEAEEIYKLLQNLHEKAAIQQHKQQQSQQKHSAHHHQSGSNNRANTTAAEMYRYRKEQAAVVFAWLLLPDW